MQEHLLCTKHFHLMHKMEFFPTPILLSATPILLSEHENLEVSIVTVFLSVQKAFVFLTFILSTLFLS